MAHHPTRPAAIRLVLALSVVLGSGLVTILAGPGTPRAAAAPLSCANGVIEVVDLSAFGGPIMQSCDTAVVQDTTTGLDVLQSTGLALEGTPQYGLQLICRIDNQPADQTCQSTPPPHAYWAYWHAAVGRDTWTFSDSGLATYYPALGSVEGWAFGDKAEPAQPPSAFRAATTSQVTRAAPPPATPPPAGTATTLPGTGGSAQTTPTSHTPVAPAAPHGASGASGRPGASAERPAVTSGPTTSSVQGVATPATTSPTVGETATSTTVSVPPPGSARPGTGREAPIVDLATGSFPTRRPTGSGSAGPALAGASLVAILALGAARTARRRRRTLDPDA